MKDLVFKKNTGGVGDYVLYPLPEENQKIEINSPIAQAMEVARKKKEAGVGSKLTIKTPQRLNVKVRQLSPEDTAKLVVAMKENLQYLEELGWKKAELEEAIRKAEDMVFKNEEGMASLPLLPPAFRSMLLSNQRSIQQIERELDRLEEDVPGTRIYADRVYLLEQTETELLRWGNERRLTKDAASFLEFALKSRLFRVATSAEVRNKSTYLVSFDGGNIIPRTLSYRDKILADRLNEICKINNDKEVLSFFKGVLLMRTQATSSLSAILEKPKEGEKVCLNVSHGDKCGYLLCKVGQREGKFHLTISDIRGHKEVAEGYLKMQKERRFLPLIFIKAGKINTFIKDKKIFDDTRIFLRDILRGLERERIDASREASINRKRLENLEKLKVS